MKLARFLFKPRWQSKDASVRRAAVVEDNDAELRAQLPLLARQDPDAGVRLAALRRLADPGLAQSMARDDADADVRKFAQSLWLELLSGTHAGAPPLEERLRLLRAQDEARVIEHLAQHAPEGALREAALARVTRPALLVERAIGESDAALRLAALERIDDEAQLARIAERMRKTDKQLTRRARERIDALRLARGDAGTLIERARTLCERVERLLRDGDDAVEDAAINVAWDAIATQVPADYAARYASARELLALRRDPQRVAALRERGERIALLDAGLTALATDLAAADADARIEALDQRHAHLCGLAAGLDDVVTQKATLARLGEALATRRAKLPQPPAPPEPAVLAAQARFAAELDAAEAERRRERERLAEAEADIARSLDALMQALGSGSTAAAHAVHAQLTEARRRHGGELPAALRRRLAEAEQEYAKIARWQRWGDSQRRRQLCDEIEALPATGLHPDALATRVREAQAEWTRLDAIEGRGGGDALGGRFRALCRRAMEPAKPYFEKRDALRKSQADELAALLARAQPSGEDAFDVRSALSLRSELATALRGLDRVDPRERKGFADRLKEAIGQLDARIAAHDAAVATAKDALIAAATALSAQPDVRSAVAEARTLQQRWKQAGNGQRRRDQQQWQAFRGAVDAVFARADAERSERDAQARAAYDEAVRLCADVEAAAAEADRATVARLEAAWSALGVRDEGLRGRFQAARRTLSDALASRERARRLDAFSAWRTRYELVREAERGTIERETLPARFDALPPSPIAARELQARLARGADAASRVEDVRDLLLQLEALAGIDPPESERQRRMDLQMERLSARLRGGAQADSVEAQLTDLLMRWSAAAPADAEQEARFEQAYSAALRQMG